MSQKKETLNVANIISPQRRITTGIILLALAASIWLIFAKGLDSQFFTTFNMVPGGSDVIVNDWTFRTLPLLNIFAGLSALIGAYQLIRGFGGKTNIVIGLVAGMFIFAFLSWAAAGQSMNLAGLIKVSLLKSVPLTLGAIAGILCERVGIVNIAIEGIMLGAAFSATLVGSLSNIWFGLLAAIATGAFLSLVHAWLSIKYKIDQIISGTVINIFSLGITSFFSAKFLQKYQSLNNAGLFPTIRIPFLSKIPFIGPILFEHNLFVYIMFALIIIVTFVLFYTKSGLRMRACGEHPKAADTLGINVNKLRYIWTVIGGMVAGIGGAFFVLGSVGRFDENMTAGRGFIAMAAMIFGNWHPVGAFGAGLLFGFADSLAAKIAILGIPIPSEFLLMAPYVATMIVLGGIVGSSRPPAAEGSPYEKE
jgi:simple sugar transport system permease protein